MKSYQQLFAELKRRHVFRVAGIYGIVAFGVLEGALEAWPILRAYAEGRYDEVPDSVWGRGGALALVAIGDADRAAEKLVELLRETPLSPDIAWRPYHDALRDDPRVQAYLASIGLGGVTVQWTPEGERVRPAILRQSDAAADAGGRSGP